MNSPKDYLKRKPKHLTRTQKLKLTRLRKGLLDWYSINERLFPWRDDSASTFERICVEVLLQRTRAETVSQIYPRFFNRFKNWQDLAEAKADELIELIRPLGLWQRRSAAIVGLASFAANNEGRFPSSLEQLYTIPSVGQYVGNAILLFQHQQSRPLLDVNMARLIERYLEPRRLADIRYDPWLQEAAHWLVREEAVTANWAALDYAALVCKARSPKCGNCQFSRTCNYFLKS